MIADLKPYPAYKDSGVPWIGNIPNHWDVARLGRYLRVKSGDMIGAYEERPEGVPIYGGNGVRGYTHHWNTEGLVIVLGRVGAKCGCVHLVDGKFWASEHALRVIRVAPIDLRFLARLLEQADLNKYAIRTAQPLINSTIVRSHRVAIPPASEQAAIVRFLDQADRRIRHYIRAKQKLIKLLEEQKQAIIHRAVTRGLDPRVPLKPSGVEWLGDVPEHWEACRVLYMTKILRGRFLHRPRNDPQFYDGEHAFIQTGDISTARKYIEGYSQTLNERGLAISKMFPAGTLVMIITGAKTGHVALLGFDACFPDSAVGFFPLTGKADTEFLYYLFITLKKELDQIAITSTQENLNVERIGGQIAVWPPIDEQKEIACHLQTGTSAIDEASVAVAKQINLIREYRTRLIADVVTGKLDVREAVARLPEEAETLQPLDDADELIDVEEDEAEDFYIDPEELQA